MTKLIPQLTREDATLMSLSDWMGFPYEPDYKAKEAAYLACEKAVLQDVFDSLAEELEEGADVVVDTTGSVIYTGQPCLHNLQKLTTVVHLATAPDQIRRMRDAYVSRPRPVLWRDHFELRPGESHAHAFTRCYPQLLVERKKSYRALAAVTITPEQRAASGFDVEDLLACMGTDDL